ncbi:amidohydrolase family protein [Alkaliphilus serpentinus]|uniref:Amidohydrolase family protein n=1 Tax=Alkaliphilus serpentinus TaxID=1482731 RepID=A0A833HLR5_9FIRM|nr:amidohydrolase family protein [Alkaliphilus serpentinus]
MKIIDAHMHLSNIKEFKSIAVEKSTVDYSCNGLVHEYKASNVVLGIAMGLTETNSGRLPDHNTSTPMGIDLEDKIPSNIVYCLGINPYKLGREEIKELELRLQRPEVVGLKVYLGYYPFYGYDEVYKPVYELAEKYKVPVVFHTGDTLSDEGLLKYSHPLTLDEIAVKHRWVNFVMAHFGDPWCLDAAEVVYKNSNMFADLSGLMVGNDKTIKRLKDSPLFFHHLRHGLAFCDNYSKFLFGTDWPLVPIAPYIEFVRELIPEEYHQEVFYDTATKVFPKIKRLL